ncbi:MAG: aminoacyl-tRNA hydrolase [Syntrophomonadaceae bacterium]|nr:aminoacyl-tRNA hydrolase [Syntrophomonadaceae bacterium]MDD3889651.1 aminoacyl-tRNA hydrolase [Syntrophomonadaceae bacterium]MDD4548951.1 aminoacyl-tRNA hydrolase [Syntrophomonadaceae bacterium]
MKIIVGLGNPGRKYKDTRHNTGYQVVEELAGRYTIAKEESKFDSIIGHLQIGTEKVLVVKPLTYMNLSGSAVQPLMHWYKLALSDLMVVYDDMDLPTGLLRIRATGGTGGHKGMVSICQRLGSNDFPRIRVGIGRPADDTVDWVLGKFYGEEKQIMQATIEKAADALEYWIKNGIVTTMNMYN